MISTACRNTLLTGNRGAKNEVLVGAADHDVVVPGVDTDVVFQPIAGLAVSDTTDALPGQTGILR